MEKTYKQRELLITILSYMMLGVVAVYLIYCFAAKKEPGMTFGILICIMLAVFWFLQDVVRIKALNRFEGKSPNQIEAYKKYALLDLAGYAGLGYFAVAVGSNTGMYGALVYVLTTMYKRKQLDKFRNPDPEEEHAEGEEAAEAAKEDPAAEAPAQITDEAAGSVNTDLTKKDRIARMLQSVEDADEDAAFEEIEESTAEDTAEDTAESTED